MLTFLLMLCPPYAALRVAKAAVEVAKNVRGATHICCFVIGPLF